MSVVEDFISKLSNDVAIDLGTANIRIYVRGEKDIIKEPSIIAINKNTNKILAVGYEAREMVGRTPSSIKAIQPLKKGVISDFTSTESLIKYFLARVKNNSPFLKKILKPRVVIGVPTTITEVEINSVIDSAKIAGARKVFIVEEPIASAIGAGIDMDSTKGALVVDIGGGTTDIALISMGEIVKDNTIQIAGDNMDNAIVDYIKNKYNLSIGIKLAEDIKIKYGAAIGKNSEIQIEINGQDLLTGLPKRTKIYKVEITEALLPIFNKISAGIKEALDDVQPELISDLLEKGVYLTGGGALIEGIDKFLSNKLKLPFIVADDASLCVTKGIIKMVEEVDLLHKHQVKDLILK